MKQNKTLIKELRQELHYYQMMVRVDLRAVKAGVTKCKEIGAKMRALQNSSQLTKRALDGANVCRVIKHVYIDGTCAQCGAREPGKSDDEEAYQTLLDEAPMYYPDNPPRK